MNQNIFLDFLNRDSREIYGLFTDTSRVIHLGFLLEALNVAVFLCGEFCIVPAGFSIECDIAKEALLLRQEYRRERLIRMAIREETVEKLLAKKLKEYSSFRRRYRGIFEPSSQDFLKQFPLSGL